MIKGGHQNNKTFSYLRGIFRFDQYHLVGYFKLF